MSAAWVWRRCQWRRRRVATWATVGLLAVAVAIVLTAVAGARRTETAYPRMLEATRGFDVLANPDRGARTALDFDAVAALPDTQTLGRAAGLFVVLPDAQGNPDFEHSVLALASADGVFGYDLGRLNYVAGRPPDPERADEVAMDPELAARLGVGLGDTMELLVPDFSAGPPADGGPPPLEPVPLRVVGLGWDSSQILSDETFASNQLLVSPAYYREHLDQVGFWGLVADVGDGSADAVLRWRREVDALAPGEDIEYRSQAVDTAAVARAVRPEVLALEAFAFLVALAALVVVGQALTRLVVYDSAEARTLHAVGLRRPTLVAGALARALVLAAAGVAVGVGLAFAASDQFPVGIARRAEPHPGRTAHVAILGLGGLVAVALLLVVVAVPVWRSATLRAPRNTVRRPSRSVATLRRMGAGPTAVTGVGFALEPLPGRSAASAWGTIAGGIAVVTLLSSTAVFAASLGRLVDSPRLYGWNWDLSIDVGGHDPALQAFLDDDPRVEASSNLTNNRLVLDGRPVPTVGVSTRPGALTPTVVRGRPIEDDDEVALGGRTLDQLGIDLGDQVTAVAPDGHRTELEVVGQAVFPGLGTYGGAERTELGTGAMTSIRTLAELGPPLDNGVVAVRLRPSADADEVGRDAVAAQVAAGAEPDETAIDTSPQRPSDIVALDRIRATPGRLALLVGTLIVVQLVVALFGSSRRRRRDLALLATLGFRRRQVAGTVVWQAVTLVGLALLIGLPLGVAVGRAAWTGLIEGLGAVPAPVVPTGRLAALAAAVVLATVLLALTGGALLARRHPARTLRAE